MSDIDSRFPAPDIQLAPEAEQLETTGNRESPMDPELQNLIQGFHDREQNTARV